jgi:MFS transporter, CP family, cyanate transporter
LSRVIGPPGPGIEAAPDRSRAPAAGLLGLTLMLTAINLRAAATSVGPLLREIQADLGMSDTIAGVLTSLPVLCFGLVGLFSGRLGRRFGAEPTVVLALVLLAGGLVLRANAPSVGWLLASSLVALVGIAVANVLVPVLVKAWFPQDVGRATGWYSMALAAGVGASAALTVPLASLLGGWRPGLGIWAAPIVVALIPWSVIARRRPLQGRAAPLAGGHPDEIPRGIVRRSPQAWALAVFFGIQSTEAYVAMGWLPAILRDAGVPPARAGVYLGITMGIGAPISLLLPRMAARRPDQRPFVVLVVLGSLAAYLGLYLAPAAAPLLWALLLGVGLGAFPLALVLLGLRAETPRGTSDLSALAQGVGYLLAVAGPLAVGAIHERTGSWSWPIAVLGLLLVPKTVTGFVAARPGLVDRP